MANFLKIFFPCSWISNCVWDNKVKSCFHLCGFQPSSNTNDGLTIWICFKVISRQVSLWFILKASCECLPEGHHTHTHTHTHTRTHPYLYQNCITYCSTYSNIYTSSVVGDTSCCDKRVHFDSQVNKAETLRWKFVLISGELALF